MLFLTVAAVMLTTSYVPIQTAFAASKDDTPSCNVNAWVRAEDLSPNAIVNGSLFNPNSDFHQHLKIPPCPNSGDLRIKVDQVCTDEVASVSLELRLDEFSEVKYQWVAISTSV